MHLDFHLLFQLENVYLHVGDFGISKIMMSVSIIKHVLSNKSIFPVKSTV